MSIWRWADLIEPIPAAAQITLGEGNTPLVRSRRIGPAAGLSNLFFKLEQCNPSGSFKDRFAVAAVAQMLANRKSKCIATSSGNTGASLAAYCAVAAIECKIAIVETAPLGKLKQMLAYGASLARVRGFGIDANTTGQVFCKLQEIGRRPDWALQVSAFVFSPAGMSGMQTISYELAEQTAQPIDHVFCPAGGGGLCVAVSRGFRKLAARGDVPRSPKVECVQPAGNDTIATPLRAGSEARAVQCTTTISGLQVANVVDGHLAIEECRATGGTGHVVDDEDVWEVQKRLACEEGIFSEPAGAVALAGALQAAATGLVRADATIVCMVTGSGFKDDAAVDRIIAQSACPMFAANELDAWSDAACGESGKNLKHPSTRDRVENHPSIKTAFVKAAFVEAVFVEAVFVEAVFVEAAFVEAAFVEAAFVEAAFVEAAFVEESAFVMRKSKTLARIRNHETVRLCCLGNFIPAFVKHAAHFGFDCIWLDLEHRNFSDRDVQLLLTHSHLHDIDIMVRPPTLEKTRLYRYLEDGATGLMIPLVNTAEKARLLVDAVKFPPLGDRGLDGAGLDADYYVHGADSYLEQANTETFLVVQIETPQAIENVDEIAAVPGVDGLFIGPGDLGLRLKLQAGDLTLESAFERTASSCKRHGKAWGAPAPTPEILRRLRGQGGQLLAHGGDFWAIMKTLQESAAAYEI